MANFYLSMDFSDLVKFHATLKRIGGMQQKYVTQAVRAGQKYMLNEVKNSAPEGKTGNLKANIVSVGERSRVKGKKVYETTFAGGEEANNVLQKKIKRPGAAGGTSKKAYYPASVEYGFLTRANEGRGLKYVAARTTGVGLKRVEGKYFMRNAANRVGPKAEQIMIDTLTKRIEREWKKKL